MKKVIPCLLIVLMLASCANEVPEETTIPVIEEVNNITIDNEELVATVGDTIQVDVKAPSSVATLKYTISDESVATVDENGVITALSYGAVTLTVSSVDGTFMAERLIEVNDPNIVPKKPQV